jgi:hypothetical protein
VLLLEEPKLNELHYLSQEVKFLAGFVCASVCLSAIVTSMITRVDVTAFNIIFSYQRYDVTPWKMMSKRHIWSSMS